MPNFISGQVIMLNIQARVIPVDKPGLYRWYAKEDDFRLLISSQYLDGVKNGRDYAQELLDFKNNPSNTGKKKLDEILWNGVTYYGIYLGKTTGSLRKRVVLDHMNGLVTDSTLRKAVSTLIFGFKAKEDEITDFIGRLVVQFDEYVGPLASESDREKAKKWINNSEKTKIAEFLSPLNINSNKQNKDVCTPMKEFLDDFSNKRDSITWKP